MYSPQEERSFELLARPDTLRLQRSRYSTPNSRRSFIGTRARCATRPHDATSPIPIICHKESCCTRRALCVPRTAAFDRDDPHTSSLEPGKGVCPTSRSLSPLCCSRLTLLHTHHIPTCPTSKRASERSSTMLQSATFPARVQTAAHGALSDGAGMHPQSSGGPVGCTFAAIDRNGKILVNASPASSPLLPRRPLTLLLLRRSPAATKSSATTAGPPNQTRFTACTAAPRPLQPSP